MPDDQSAYQDCEEPGTSSATSAPVPQSRPVDDVQTRFLAIRRDCPHYLGAWDGGFIPGSRYTFAPSNAMGFNNHFQGVVRLPGTRYLLFTGGDKKEPEGHLFVARLDSRRVRGTWGSNQITVQRPPEGDSVVSGWRLGRHYWHAGGLGVEGKLVVIPLESNDDNSRIEFFDVSDPETPRRYDVAIKRDGRTLRGLDRESRKAAAADVMTVDDGPLKGHLLVAIRVGNGRGFDFYLSKGEGLSKGFPSRPEHFRDQDVLDTADQQADVGDYQSITLMQGTRGSIRAANDAGAGNRHEQTDGRLFLFGAYNTTDVAPINEGTNRIDLFEVHLDEAALDEGGLRVAAITHLERAEFPYNWQHNMDAAASLYRDRLGRLHVYSVFHFRSNERFRFCEFQAPHPDGLGAITRLQDAWVEIYDEPHYAGKHFLSLRGPGEAKLEDWDKVRVADRSFADGAASVRYQLPPGHAFVLYRRRGFQGARARVLRGTGEVEKSELGYLHRRVASCRYERR